MTSITVEVLHCLEKIRPQIVELSPDMLARSTKVSTEAINTGATQSSKKVIGTSGMSNAELY
jgi:hypothetical protein